jgi:hypothetical protein
MKFHCTYCGHKVETASDSLGQLMTCPSCSAEIPVPNPSVDSPFAPSGASKADAVASPLHRTWGVRVRRIFLISLLACFVVGAATAILALLSFQFGETEAKILLTTLSLGVYSLTGLCCALLTDQRRYRVFSGLGIAASILGALFAILTNWEIVTGLEVFVKGRLSFLVVAVAFGHAALLLRINTASAVVRVVRSVTLGIIALVGALFLVITMDPGSIPVAWVCLGILGVLDVLGTIATAILHLANRGDRTG